MENETAVTSSNAQTPGASHPGAVPSEQEIAARAYEIFLSRGATDGSDLDDWLQAERELTAKINETPKTRTATA